MRAFLPLLLAASFWACDTDLVFVQADARKGDASSSGTCYTGLAPLHDAAYVARDSAASDVSGPVAAVFLGASTTRSLAQAAEQAYRAAPDSRSDVAFINGATSGRYAESWANASDRVWRTADRAVTGAGYSLSDVQVVFVKSFSTTQGSVSAQVGLINQIIANAVSRWPSVKEIYVLDEGYGGYAGYEPEYHTTGVVVNAVVASQANGAVAVAHGAYLWADGLGSDCVVGGVPGRADGMEYAPDDFRKDGYHQSSQGAAKQAALVLEALRADPVASQWAIE